MADFTPMFTVKQMLELDFESDGTRRFYFVSNKIVADYVDAEELVAKHYYGRGV